MRPAFGSSATSSDEAEASTVAVAEALHRLEDLLDDAFAAAGALSINLVAARRAHRRSAIVGQRVFAELGAVQAALSTARGHAVGAHRLLDSVAQAMGIDTPDFGDGGKGPGFVEPFFGRSDQVEVG